MTKGANAQEPVPTVEPTPLPTPSQTYYGQMAAALIATLDQFTASIPDFGNPQNVTREFIKRKRRVPQQFVDDAVSALLVDPELQGVRSLNAAGVIDDQQFLDAFRPVARHLEAMSQGLQFTVDVREARLAASSQQIYGIAKAMSRDRQAASLSVHVENMKRSYTPRRRRKTDGEEGTGAKKKGGAADKNPQQQQ